jgi:hypothetical protein
MAAEPTVPNRIADPLSVPLTARVLGGVESLIVPFRFDPDSFQLRVNVPPYVPL